MKFENIRAEHILNQLDIWVKENAKIEEQNRIDSFNDKTIAHIYQTFKETPDPEGGVVIQTTDVYKYDINFVNDELKKRGFRTKIVFDTEKATSNTATVKYLEVYLK